MAIRIQAEGEPGELVLQIGDWQVRQLPPKEGQTPYCVTAPCGEGNSILMLLNTAERRAAVQVAELLADRVAWVGIRLNPDELKQ